MHGPDTAGPWSAPSPAYLSADSVRDRARSVEGTGLDQPNCLGPPGRRVYRFLRALLPRFQSESVAPRAPVRKRAARNRHSTAPKNHPFIAFIHFIVVPFVPCTGFFTGSRPYADDPRIVSTHKEVDWFARDPAATC